MKISSNDLSHLYCPENKSKVTEATLYLARFYTSSLTNDLEPFKQIVSQLYNLNGIKVITSELEEKTFNSRFDLVAELEIELLSKLKTVDGIIGIGPFFYDSELIISHILNRDFCYIIPSKDLINSFFEEAPSLPYFTVSSNLYLYSNNLESILSHYLGK